MKKTILLVIFELMAFLCYGQQSLWVGESYRFDVTSSVMGLTANTSWSTSGGYLQLTGSGFYRDIKVTQYFSGSATVTCEWDYKLTGSDSYTHVKRQVTISCRDNQVSISPTSLTMTPGQKEYVTYGHQYSNAYTSAAEAYFTSQDPSICSVSSSGLVEAKNPGTTYINVYSKISSVSPYCKVTVNKIEPTSVALPHSIEMTGGEEMELTATITPSNANTVLSWYSSDPDVVKVDNGLLKAYLEGEAIITVKTDNGLSADCQVKVNKGQLKLYSSIESGWVDKDTRIMLSASQPGSIIYYTIDKTDPTYSSAVYEKPFVAEKNLIIKAKAVKEGYYDSNIETFEYNIRDFVIQQNFPENGASVNPYVIPYIEYNSALTQGDNFEEVAIIDSHKDFIPTKAFIYENTLFIAPLQHLQNEMAYSIIIPEAAVINEEGEANKAYGFSFNTGERVIKIAFGEENCGILTSDGSFWMWGYQRFGQLGDGSTLYNILTEPEFILDNVTDFALSNQRGFALKSDASVWAWGKNDSGYLGTGNTTNQTTPVRILSDVKKIYAGYGTSAAIKNNGDLYMWGSNSHGQIGDGSITTAKSPKKILTNVTDVSVRYNHTCAVVDGRVVYSWGHNCHREHFPYKTYGQGVEIKTPFRWNDYSADAVETTEGNTILIKDGELKICGINYNGVVGSGMTQPYVLESLINPISGIKEVKTGTSHILALDNNDTLWGWGNNNNGQIGDFTTSNVYKPYEILSDVEYFSTWGGTSAAILKNGDVYVWGNNEEGQLMGVSNQKNVLKPTKIIDGPKVKDLESVSIIGSSPIVKENDTTVAFIITQPVDASISSLEFSSSNEKIATVNELGVISGISEGTVDIIATVISPTGETWTCSREITVVRPEIPQFSVEEALDFINGKSGEAIVKGLVSEINEINPLFGTATYSIKDNLDRQSSLLIYKGLFLNGEPFTSVDDIAIGDYIEVKGMLDRLEGDTPAMMENNRLLNHISGITEIMREEETRNKIFNLQGIRVTNPVRGQIYILNGKKIIY